MVVRPLEEDSQYKFLEILENVRQGEKRKLECAEKTYLQRLSVIWSSPRALSDANHVAASNQCALAGLKYPMWTQHWPLTELRRIDREDTRHNNALKVLNLELLRELQLVESLPAWYSQSSLNQNTSRRMSKHCWAYQLMGRTMNCKLTESMQR